MRRLMIFFMVLTMLFLSGCSLHSSDAEKMFDCFLEFGNEDGCSRNMSEVIVPNGVIDYIDNGKYDVSLEDASIEGQILTLGNHKHLEIVVEFDELVVTTSMIDVVVELTEDVYNDALEKGVELHSVVIIFQQYNDFGYDSIQVLKSYDTDDCGINVYYHTDIVNVDSIFEEKEVISSLFSNQELFNIRYRLSYIDDTKDYTIDSKLSLYLNGEKESDNINYHFSSFSNVDIDFDYDDFSQNLFDEIPEKQFSYDGL